MFHCSGGYGGVTLAGKVQSNQGAAPGQENQRSQSGDDNADQELETEGMPDAHVVTGAVKLGGEDSRAGAGAEDAQVEDKQQPVDDGHAAHGNGAHLAHHDIVQQGDKIGNAVLDDNGDGDPKDTAVKRLVADVSIQHNSIVSLEWRVES